MRGSKGICGGNSFVLGHLLSDNNTIMINSCVEQQYELWILSSEILPEIDPLVI